MTILHSPVPQSGSNRPNEREPVNTQSARRILYVLTNLAFGGAETQVVDLAARVQADGWQVQVVSLLPASQLTDRLDQLQIPWVSLDGRQGRVTPRLVVGLRRVVRNWRPDLVHSHTLPANFVARAVRPLAAMPVLITSCHNIDEGGHARMLYYRFTERLADLTTNVSHAAVDRYIRIGAASPGRIQYMPNGIDTERFAPDPSRRQRMRRALGIDHDSDTFLWLAVGRLEDQKDYSNMLRAAARALGPRHQLLIVGAGGLQDQISEMIHALNLQDRVRLLGLRQDVPDLMRAADGYLMSSAWEGLPIVLLEAAASGLPIISTRVGGNDEIVQDGVTGFLVPPGDDRALASAMVRAQDLDPTHHAQMARAAREHVSKVFGMKKVAERWLEIYHSLLARNVGGPRT